MAQPREAFEGSPPPSCHNIQNMIKVLKRMTFNETINNQELAQETQKQK